MNEPKQPNATTEALAEEAVFTLVGKITEVCVGRGPLASYTAALAAVRVAKSIAEPFVPESVLRDAEAIARRIADDMPAQLPPEMRE